PAAGKFFGGVLALVPCWAAITALHDRQPQGWQLLLFLLVLIWAADIGAYFAGKAWGKNKLAPNISPGKTWEGVFGGLAASLAAALLANYWLGFPLLIILPLVVILVALSVVGDLSESMLKRQAHIKDSGSLFPGHGGVLDRLDSLLATAPMFLLGLKVMDAV
ncbi:MAG: phosphatidate cytidylyltransferase, partial [Gammaproteobacteria bacterium]|nr:phosphatidate cytidylyltransferase [Gammaproteobacteria bacterium]